MMMCACFGTFVPVGLLLPAFPAAQIQYNSFIFIATCHMYNKILKMSDGATPEMQLKKLQ